MEIKLHARILQNVVHKRLHVTAEKVRNVLQKEPSPQNDQPTCNACKVVEECGAYDLLNMVSKIYIDAHKAQVG